MSWRFYVMPIKLWREDETEPLCRFPQYIDTHLSGVAAAQMGYGPEDVSLVREDVGLGHAALAAEPDVLALPENLDLNLTAGAITAAGNIHSSMGQHREAQVKWSMAERFLQEDGHYENAFGEQDGQTLPSFGGWSEGEP